MATRAHHLGRRLEQQSSLSSRGLASAFRPVLITVASIAAFAFLLALSSHAGAAVARWTRTPPTPAEALRTLDRPASPVSHPASLEAFASAFRHESVTVTCITSTERWLQLSPRNVAGYVDFAHPLHVVLGPRVCSSARAAFSEPRVVSAERAVGIQLLVPQLVHTTGLQDEGQTEAVSFRLLRSTLVRFLGYTRAEAMAMDRLAWRDHLARPDDYQLAGPRRYAPWPAAAVTPHRSASGDDVLVLHRPESGGGSGRDADLRVDVLDVVVGGLGRDHEPVGDLAGREATRGEFEHVDLPAR